MKGTLRLKEIAEGGTTTHELALTRLSLWNKERDGGRCPASLPFTLSLPATFNDGRTDFYGPAFVVEGLHLWNVSPDWRKVLEHYGVNSVLVPVDSPLASVLRETHAWRVVYQDRIAVLFDKVEERTTD